MIVVIVVCDSGDSGDSDDSDDSDDDNNNNNNNNSEVLLGAIIHRPDAPRSLDSFLKCRPLAHSLNSQQIPMFFMSR